MINVMNKNPKGKAQMPTIIVCAAIRIGDAELEVVAGVAGTTVLISDATIINVILSKGASAPEGDATFLESAVMRRAANPASADGVGDTGSGTLQVKRVQLAGINRCGCA